MKLNRFDERHHLSISSDRICTICFSRDYFFEDRNLQTELHNLIEFRIGEEDEKRFGELKQMANVTLEFSNIGITDTHPQDARVIVNSWYLSVDDLKLIGQEMEALKTLYERTIKK